MSKKTIGFISMGDPFHDRRYWSGTAFKIRESLENAGFSVIWIPYTYKSFRGYLAMGLYAVLSILFRINGGPHFKPLTRAYARSIDERLIDKCDFLFFPGAAQIALYLKRMKPFIYYTDATAFLMDGYYSAPKVGWSSRSAKMMEKQATNLALINIRSSRWAINSVINDCGFDPLRSYVLEFGANVDTKDISFSDPYQGGELKVLFSGIDWERKGGDVAVKTVRILRDRGVDARLYIAGIKKLPDKYRDLDYITHVGFLNKNNQEEYLAYLHLFQSAHIFLLPTKAECSAIVFCEAAAYGIPVYTYLTGGIGDYVVNGLNGRALDLSCKEMDFAQIIIDDINDGRLESFCSGARAISREKLSWEAWSKRFLSIMEDNGLV